MSTKLPTNFDWKSITPSDSPRTPIDIMADPKLRRLGKPELKPGDQAFGFWRPLYDRHRRRISMSMHKESGATYPYLTAIIMVQKTETEEAAAPLLLQTAITTSMAI